MKIEKEMVKSICETKFIKVFDLQYGENKHYFDATRRDKEDLVCIKSEDERKTMLPDAVSIVLIVKHRGEFKLLMHYEYRYPVGEFLLSPPAGLIDAEDRDKEAAILITARREIKEETNIDVKAEDRCFVINPCNYSSAGFTDESNAFACVVTELKDEKVLNDKGAVGTELFGGFKLLSKEEAKKVLKEGRDEHGNYYSVHTMVALMYFISGLWED